jgi:hypothetical protein
MAGGIDTTYDVTQKEVLENFAKEILYETAKATVFMDPRTGLIGDGPEYCVQRKKKEFERGGSVCNFTVTRQFRGAPTGGNQTLRDREEALRSTTLQLAINTVRHAAVVTGLINKQRVPFDIWSESKTALGEYFGQLIEAGAMLHACGVPYDVSTAYEPFLDGSDAAHFWRPNGLTTDEAVDADPTAVLDLPVVCQILKAKAKTLPIPIRPMKIGDWKGYILFVHTDVALAAKQAQTQFYQQNKAALAGGLLDKNPLVIGSLGVHDGVLVLELPMCPPGYNSSTHARLSNTRRSVFCGAQSLFYGLGKAFKDQGTFINSEEDWDFGNNQAVAATTIAGMKCPAVTIDELSGTPTHEFSRIVTSSYVTASYTGN